jgi:glycosyltransferase involved in cell wall biosynthesis/MoaA/NifB/PqqE/SkfB family radical SAM enzyme
VYRHPIGELTRGAVLDVGLKCTHSCRFCYYSFLDKTDDQFRGMRRAAFRSLAECKAILDGLKLHGFTHFDYTGGEPSLHPHIIEITRYAHRELGLAGRMITLGQFLMKRMPNCRTERLVDDLLDAGLVNFLLSVHAVDEELFQRATNERWSRLRAAMEHLDARGFDYCTNTTVFEWNHTHLADIARELVRHRVYLHNFILMNAYYEWNRDGKAFGVQARYAAIRPHLAEAIAILEEHGVAVNVRYAPMCGVRGLEKHLVGVVGVRYDAHEWMNEAGHFGGAPAQCAKPLAVRQGDIDAAFRKEPASRTLANGVRIVAARGGGVKAFPSQCGSCAARDVCDGIDPNYLAQHGADEFVPYDGPTWDFPVHRARAEYPGPFLVKTAQDEDMRTPVAAAVAGGALPERVDAVTSPPRVTVVVPCYNYARYLPDAVESVVAQTFRDWELVIVDDGSTDGSLAIAAELAAAHPDRIRVVAQENAGQPAIARNRGIAEARGEYVLCLDADDRIAPTMLARCVALLDAEPEIAIAYTDRRDFDGVEQVIRAGEFDAGILPYHNHLSYCALFRKEVWDAVGGYRTNVKGCEDWDLWIAAAARGFRGRRIPEPLFWYRRHDTGLYQEALGGFADIQARIILNNREAYPAVVVDEASRRVAGSAPARPATIARPLVSVIMPTCGRPTFLRRAVASVLAQRWRPLELIVVNDGAEPVEALLRELDGEGIVVSVRTPERRERSAARNLALRIARGTYVAYLDDDDWYEPDHVATLVERLEGEGAAVAYTDARRVTESACGDAWVPTAIDRPFSVDFDREHLLVGNYIPICCLMHRRDCLERVGFFDEALDTHEDWELWLRFARHWRFVHVPQITCAYSWREDGSSTTSARPDDFPRTGLEVYRRFADDARAFPRAAEWYRRTLGSAAEHAFDVSIVIPMRNRAELTRQCLEALAANTGDVHFEVILVDDGSTDDTPAFLATLGGDVTVLRHDESRGFAASCNAGARRARGRFLCFLNNDTIPRPRWLSALVDELRAHPEVVIAGSRLLYPDGRLQHAGVVISRDNANPYHVYRGGPATIPSAGVRRETQAVTAACLLVRRETFDALGGFDETFRNGFEDVDFCLRARGAGGRVVYQPASELVHLESQSPGRHDANALNVTLFRMRWADRVVADEDAVYVADGYALRTHDRDASKRVTALTDAAERPRWERVAEVQRRAVAGGPGAAASLLRDAAECWPADAAVLQWAASLCAVAGVPERAGEFTTRARALRSGATERLEAARSAVAANDLTGATEHLGAVLDVVPGDHDALLLRGEVAHRSGDFDGALAAYRVAAAKGADVGKSALATAYAAFDRADAEAAWRGFEEVVRAAPEDDAALDGLLRLGLALERWDALATVLAPAVARRPERLDLRAALAHACVGVGRLDDARDHVAVLRATVPGWPGLRDLTAALGG